MLRGLLYLTSCFHLFWKNIFSAMYVAWGPSFEFSSVLYITPTDTLPWKTWYYKECNKNYKNLVLDVIRTFWHIESSYILQLPRYLLLFANRFRFINNNVTKDRCSIPMDTTVMLGPLKFSLRATIYYHGPSIHSGHYVASINCCKKTFYCNDNTTTEFEIIDS